MSLTPSNPEVPLNPRGDTLTEPVSRYGIRHDPAVIQAVAEAIELGFTGEEIAHLVGISPASVETIVAEHDELRLSRARVREAQAEVLVTEAQAIVDAPFEDVDTASAEVSRARNRADFRWKRAACYNRDLYGDRSQIDVRGAVAVLTAFVGSTAKPSEAAPLPSLTPHVLAPDQGFEGDAQA